MPPGHILCVQLWEHVFPTPQYSLTVSLMKGIQKFRQRKTIIRNSTADAETGSCSAPPSSHGLLLGSLKLFVDFVPSVPSHIKTPLQQQFDSE